MTLSRSSAQLPVALAEELRQYVLSVKLPGLARNQVRLKVEEGMLRVLDTTATPVDQSRRKKQGKVISTFILPRDVATESIVADVQNSVLKVRLPKFLPELSTWWRRW